MKILVTALIGILSCYPQSDVKMPEFDDQNIVDSMYLNDLEGLW